MGYEPDAFWTDDEVEGAGASGGNDGGGFFDSLFGEGGFMSGFLTGGGGALLMGSPLGAAILGIPFIGSWLGPALGGDDPREFWKQLEGEGNPNRSSWNVAYEAWCREFYPHVIASGDVWDMPQSVQVFRERVSAWKDPLGIDWSTLIGKIGLDYQRKPEKGFGGGSSMGGLVLPAAVLGLGYFIMKRR